MRVQLEFLHGCFLVCRHVLRQRDEEHRANRLARLIVLGIAHHADNPESAGVGGEIEADAFIQRIFVRKKSPDESLIEYCNRSGGRVIGFREASSPDDGLAGGLKIARADPVPGSTGILVETRCGTTGNEGQFSPIVGEGII